MGSEEKVNRFAYYCKAKKINFQNKILNRQSLYDKNTKKKRQEHKSRFLFFIALVKPNTRCTWWLIDPLPKNRFEVSQCLLNPHVSRWYAVNVYLILLLSILVRVVLLKVIQLHFWYDESLCCDSFQIMCKILRLRAPFFRNTVCKTPLVKSGVGSREIHS